MRKRTRTRDSYYKYPTPALITCNTVHLHESIGQNACEGRGDTAYEVEDRETLLQLVPGVPGGDEVKTSCDTPH